MGMRERDIGISYAKQFLTQDIPSDIVSPSLQRGSVTVTDVNSTLIGASTDTSENDKEHQDEEMCTRMEEQLQSLIEQGQAALTSKG